MLGTLLVLAGAAYAVLSYLMALPHPLPQVAAPRSPAPAPRGRYFDEVGERTGLVHDDATFPTDNPFDDWTAGGGVAVDDVDGDGDPDVFLTSLGASNRLFLNRGDGTFEDGSEAWGVAGHEARTIGAAFADHDDDGDPDLFLMRDGPDHVLRNDAGHFTDVTGAAGLFDPGRSTSISFADYDGDGDLDAYVTAWWNVPSPKRTPAMLLPWVRERQEWPPKVDLTGVIQPGHLFRNEGDGTFQDVSDLLPPERRGTPSFVATWSDFDADGDPDLYVVNDFAAFVQPNQLYRNDGPGADGRWRFTPVSAECGCAMVGAGMGLSLIHI